MKVIYALSLILVFVAACSTIRGGEGTKRTPANSDVNQRLENINSEPLIAIIKLALENDKDFKILNFPPRAPEDVENSQELTALGLQLSDSINGFYEAFYKPLSENDLHAVPHSLIGEKLNADLRKAFTKVELSKIFKMCSPNAKDKTINIGSSLVGNICEDYNFILSEDDLRDSFDYILKNINSTEVKYDGATGFNAYSDPLLEEHLRKIAFFISFDKMRFISIFDSLSQPIKDLFQKNTNTDDPATRVEPFDLLSNIITWSIVFDNYGKTENVGDLNKIYVGKLVEKSLSRLFQIPKEKSISDSLPTFSVMKKGDSALYWCASGRFKPREYMYYRRGGYINFNRASNNQLVEFYDADYGLDAVFGNRLLGFTFHCNTMEYKVSISAVPVQKINPPKDIDYKDQKDINVLITVALVTEMRPAALRIGKLFLNLVEGWETVEDMTLVESRKSFENLFVNTDIYIPVSHAMDVNSFHVGTKKGYLLKVKKDFNTPTGVKTVYASIILPKSDIGFTESLYLNPESLSEILHARTQSGRQPLFLMNTSCGSEDTLFTWLATYRKMLDKKVSNGSIADYSEDFNTPHIIGSKRYFDTDSTAVLLSHLTYPLKTIEHLAMGKSVQEVVSFLKQPSEKNFVSRVLGYFSKSDDNSSDDQNQSFAPDYILDHPNLLQIGGFRISVDRRGFESTKEY